MLRTGLGVMRVVGLSAATALAVIGIVVEQLISWMRAARLGCSESSDGEPGYVCPDGIWSVVPFAALVALFFVVAAAVVVNISFRLVPAPRRLVIALRTERIFGFLLLGGASLGLVEVLIGPYDHSSWWGAIVPIGLGLAAITLPAAAGQARALTMAVSAIVLALLCTPVFLISPLLLLAAGVALVDIMVRASVAVRLPVGTSRR